VLPVWEIGGLRFLSFSVLLLCAVYAPLWLMVRRGGQQGLPFREVRDGLFFAGPFVLVGGKLLFLLNNPITDYVWPETVYFYIFGGFAFYGCLFGFILGLYLYARRKTRPFLDYMNFLAPYMAMALGFVRIGCLLNGCCYGAASDSILALRYPAGHPTYGEGVWPVPLLESLACFLLALFLFSRKDPAGNFTRYLLAYAVLRFFLEFWRGDPVRGFYGVFSTSQWISAGIVIFIALRWALRRKSTITG
jgi:phosphatidylglycerol:prolipoprotein diacylglycerol transferase